jgi:putative transposase
VRGEWGVSIRRTCRVLEVDTSTYHYKSRRPGQAVLEGRIKEICQTRVRYGYRRVHVLLRREGWGINHKKTYRIYREMGLQLRNKTPKRRVKAKLREDRKAATGPNQTWAMDFVHDQLATARKLRVLTVVDIFSRFSPAIDPRFTYRGEDVVRILEQVCAGGRLSGDDPGRSGKRVRLAGSRPVGIRQGRDTRLLTARQTDRQCVHRSVQRPLSCGMLERPLVHEP